MKNDSKEGHQKYGLFPKIAMSGADFDKVLERLSVKETYQNWIFLLLCLPAGLPAVVIGFSHFFVSAIPKIWYCDVSNITGFINETVYFEGRQLVEKGCSVPYLDEYGKILNHTCSSWIYNTSEFEETLVTKFDMVCDKESWITHTTTLFYSGSIFGNLFFGWASDRWGRRTMLMPILFFSTVLPIVSTMVVNYEMYGVLRFLSGLLFPAIYQVPLILTLELHKPTRRTARGILMSAWFAVSTIIMAVIAYFTRTWKRLLLVSTIPQIIFISYYWLIPESPRWLLSKNRVDEAEAIIQKMAKRNKVKIPANYLLKMQSEESSPESAKSANLIDMLKYPRVTQRYLIILFNWASGALIYHGLMYFSAYLDLNIFVSFGLGGIVEILACIVAWKGMEYSGRKKMNILCMLIGGISCICTIFFDGKHWMFIFLTMVGKLGCSTAFNVFYLYVAELLPTVIRNQAMSTASLVASIIMLTFPYLIEKAKDNRELPLLVMGVLSIIGGLSTVTLPETLNCSLPQTLEDAEAMPTPNIFCMGKKKGAEGYIPANQTTPQEKS